VNRLKVVSSSTEVRDRREKKKIEINLWEIFDKEKEEGKEDISKPEIK